MDNLDREKSVVINIGKSFSMYGVSDIRAFDEGYISLDTSSGRITVEGRELKIESLSKDDGHINVRGDVTGVFCESVGNVKKGFFKRLVGG